MPNSNVPTLADLAEQSSTFDPDPDGTGEDTPAGADAAAADDKVYWRGILAPLDVTSGDGMQFATPDELRVRPLPLPLTYQERTAPGHDGATVVGRITNVWVGDVEGSDGTQMRAILAEGELDPLDETASELRRKLEDGYAGWISIETDATVGQEQASGDGDDAGAVLVATDYRVMGASLVSQPAFAEARIALANGLLGDSVHQPDDADEAAGDDGGAGRVNDEEKEKGRGRAAELTAAVIGDTDLPWAPRDREWDGSAARDAVATWASSDGSGDKDTIDWGKYGRAFLYRDDSGDSGTTGRDFGEFKYPFATVIDGTLTAVYRAIASAAAYLNRDNNGIPQGDESRVRGKLAQLYREAADEFDDDSIKPPWEQSSQRRSGTPVQQPDAAIAACALLAAGGPTAPPSDWFTNPQLAAPTALTVDDDGRVYGHLAAKDACHTGFPGSCVTPPTSRSQYAYFHTGAIRTRDGQDLPVGTLVVGTDHPDGSHTASSAMSYYANTGAAVAAVRAGEDAHGIWVAGAVLPGVGDDQVATLRRSPLSGDWRVIGGHYELVAALCVNTPGFPIPRARVASAVGGAPWSLVAAGVLAPSHRGGSDCGCGTGDSPTAAAKAGDGDPVLFARTVAAELARIADAATAAPEPDAGRDTGDVHQPALTAASRARRARSRIARNRLTRSRG